MATKFYTRTLTAAKHVPGISRNFDAKFYVSDPADIMIEPVSSDANTGGTSGANAGNWGVCGTNGSFFTTQSVSGKPVGLMTALHINLNANMGSNLRGDINRQDYFAGNTINTAMDIIYYTGSSVGLLPKTDSWTSTNNRGITRMDWGIGGFNLMLSNLNINSESTFLTQFKKYYSAFPSANISQVNISGTTSRTLIGYRSVDKKIILAAIFGSGNSVSNGS